MVLDCPPGNFFHTTVIAQAEPLVGARTILTEYLGRSGLRLDAVMGLHRASGEGGCPPIVMKRGRDVESAPGI